MSVEQTLPPGCLGFLGGSFDPVHTGHLLIAQDAREFFHLRRVFFLPARRSPFKRENPVASFADRTHLLEVAIRHRPEFAVLTVEEELPDPSYTIQTVELLEKRFPGEPICWIIGSDQLPDLAKWRHIEELTRKVTFLCLARPGLPLNIPPLTGLRCLTFSAHQMEVSSREIRQRRADGKPIDLFLPHAVCQEICERHLYLPKTWA